TPVAVSISPAATSACLNALVADLIMSQPATPTATARIATSLTIEPPASLQPQRESDRAWWLRRGQAPGSTVDYFCRDHLISVNGRETPACAFRRRPASPPWNPRFWRIVHGDDSDVVDDLHRELFECVSVGHASPVC